MDKKQIQLTRENAEKHEINTPNHSNQLFIDCFIANLANQYSDDTDVFDAPEIQAISGAMLDLFNNQRIRYIPFGSKLYKDLHKIKRHQGHLTPLFGKYSDSFFGMFYLEKENQNKVKNVMEKYEK